MWRLLCVDIRRTAGGGGLILARGCPLLVALGSAAARGVVCPTRRSWFGCWWWWCGWCRAAADDRARAVARPSMTRASRDRRTPPPAAAAAAAGDGARDRADGQARPEQQVQGADAGQVRLVTTTAAPRGPPVYREVAVGARLRSVCHGVSWCVMGALRPERPKNGAETQTGCRMPRMDGSPGRRNRLDETAADGALPGGLAARALLGAK